MSTLAEKTEAIRNALAQPRARRAVVVALAVLTAIVGTLAGWRLAGAHEIETDLGRVAFEVSPSAGGMAEAYVPLADWGFRADLFRAPFTVKGEVRALDRQGIMAAAGGKHEVLSASEGQLRRGAQLSVIRSLAFGVAVTLALAVLVAFAVRWMRRRALFVVATAGLALAGAGCAALAAVATFDVKALEHPTYYARGSELAQILTLVERERERSGYSSTIERVLRSFSTYLANSKGSSSGSRELILASDLHNNALVLDALERFAGERPLIFAGDFGQDGNETEAELLAPRLAKLSKRVAAVSGNHDSKILMKELSRAGIDVLNDRETKIDGLRVAGFADPMLWRGSDPSDPTRIFSFSELPDGKRRLRQAKRDVLRWFEGLKPRPDVVVIHQNALAQHLARELADREDEPLTILTGHDHLQHINRYGEITVVDGGTLGAGGIFGSGEEFAGLALLHFDADEPVLDSVDLISIEPFSGQAQAERIVIDSACAGKDGEVRERCSVEPKLPAAVLGKKRPHGR